MLGFNQLRLIGRRARGFTLIELLAVVALVGILATLALLGYRKYLQAARSAEAKEMIGAIRAAQDNYRGETLGYLNLSATLTDYYPWTPAELAGKKGHWIRTAHARYPYWQMLNVSSDGPVHFGYACVAGGPGALPPGPSTTFQPTWPATVEPWYVIQAAGDQDNDTSLSYFVSSSFSGEIYVENETE